jgi:hypothetical protein
MQARSTEETLTRYQGENDPDICALTNDDEAIFPVDIEVASVQCAPTDCQTEAAIELREFPADNTTHRYRALYRLGYPLPQGGNM